MAVDVGRHGVISVFHPTGVVIFRVPGGAGSMGQSAAADPVMRASRERPAGVVVGPLRGDSEQYISAYQTLGAPPPVVVGVSLSRADILAEWHTQLRTALVALGALTMTLSAIVLVLFRQMAARARVESELQQLQDDEATRLRGANEQLEAALEREQRARREAEAASRLKDEFLMTLSHELRTPLTAIFGWVRMLATGRFRDEQRARALSAVERNARAQTRLIDDLLDVSRAISGKLRLESRPVQRRRGRRGGRRDVAPAARGQGHPPRVDHRPDVGPISRRPDRVQQIVWNLLSNAIKFTPRGRTRRLSAGAGRTSTSRSSSATPGSASHPEFLPVRVRAVPPGRRRHAGGGTAASGSASPSSGISSSCTAAASRAESAGEGRGATFRVMLPARAPRRDRAPTSPWRAPRRRQGRARLDGIRVLVVDDEADARDLFASILGRAGAAVTTAGSAAEARDAIGGGVRRSCCRTSRCRARTATSW